MFVCVALEQVRKPCQRRLCHTRDRFSAEPDSRLEVQPQPWPVQETMVLCSHPEHEAQRLFFPL